jgi:hypothetical protein
MPFDPAHLALLAASEEVEIETTASDGTTHRTTIWIVVADDAPYVRSVRGESGRWYQEALARPAVTLHVGPLALPCRAVPVTSPTEQEACSRALRAKYRGDPSLPSMLRPSVVPTTLRLEAA